jgi:hypothetical protein
VRQSCLLLSTAFLQTDTSFWSFWQVRAVAVRLDHSHSVGFLVGRALGMP